ncbi:ATP-binding cassette domain-containing protein [candidate division KSB1 bacterium]|nr:ATP-binding cassette domain-containing protein [candidate division KSB1 bacterium]
MVILQGDNGSGKTTLLHLIAGMIPHFIRGSQLEGDILLWGRSIAKISPRHFFPRIGFIPGTEIDLFLLNRTLAEESMLIQAILKCDCSVLENRKDELAEQFPEITRLWDQQFNQMTLYQKRQALLWIYFLQGARFFLIDEIFDSFSPEQCRQWMQFLDSRIAGGCGAIFVSHRPGFPKCTAWELRENALQVEDSKSG